MPIRESVTPLDYATPPAPHGASMTWLRGIKLPWLPFISGAALGGVVIAVLWAREAWFQMMLFFAPTVAIGEVLHPDYLGALLCIGGPLLYGVYAVAMTSRRWLLYASIAAVIHAASFAVVLAKYGTP